MFYTQRVSRLATFDLETCCPTNIRTQTRSHRRALADAEADDLERRKLDERAHLVANGRGQLQWLDSVSDKVPFALVVAVSLWGAFVYFGWRKAALSPNAFGDSMAPLGVFLSFVALLYVARGLDVQSTELELQRIELQMARLENRAQRWLAFRPGLKHGPSLQRY